MSNASTVSRMPQNPTEVAGLVAFHELSTPKLVGDLRIGANAISILFHGSDDIASVRSTRNMLLSSSVPSFKLGARVCVRESTVRAKIWSQEKRAFAMQDEELLVRTHILLRAALSLLATVKSGGASPDEAVQLAAVVAEAVPTIEQLIQVKAGR